MPIIAAADLDVVYAGTFDFEKDERILRTIGQRAEIRWVQGETVASATIESVDKFAYDLLIA